MTAQPPAFDTIPRALREYDQWIGWEAQQRDGKETKVPLNPSTGSFASTTDSETWTSFETARQAVERERADGIGFVFTDDDPFVGIDLDHCRVAETGTIHEWAQSIVDQLNSYTEISPSGTGLHVLVRGALPKGGNRSGDVELYETARFFTVTGTHLDGTPTEIHDRTKQVAIVHRDYVADEPSEQVIPPATDRTSAEQLGDTDLIERAQQAANGEKFSRLWNGSTGGYDSHSEADMALCSMLAFWTGGDPVQVDRLFRASGLYRPKWDEIHFADGSTYGEKTVERAITGTSEFYTPPQSETSTERESSAEAAETIAELRGEIERLTKTLARRRETIERLEEQIHSLESTNSRLETELDAARATAAENHHPDERSLWDRLLG